MLTNALLLVAEAVCLVQIAVGDHSFRILRLAITDVHVAARVVTCVAATTGENILINIQSV